MWFEKLYRHRKWFIGIFAVLSVLSLFSLPFLKFKFNLEQFFPQGDEDLEYFQKFIEEFESDDNFLLIALVNQPSVFEQEFLSKVDSFTKSVENVPYVKNVQSLTNFSYPQITTFGPRFNPAIHINDESKLIQDSIKLMGDERIVNNLINENAQSTVVILKTSENTQIEECKQIMSGVDSLLNIHAFDDYHMLGRAYFQTELSVLQFKEILLSTIVSGILISIVMIIIFRRWRSILIALGSIGIGLLLFMATLSLLGRELTIMAALYPILMLIVGTSDVVHIMTKYFDELKKGLTKKAAIKITLVQIGMATLLTSLTTAAGFATLLTSRIEPIRDFGINAAIGVVMAYIVVVGFTCPLMTFFKKADLIHEKSKVGFWSKWLEKSYQFTLYKRNLIIAGFFGFILFCFVGIKLIHTNYEVAMNLPKGAKITEDFKYFEKEYAGFRPLELAGIIQEGHDISDYKVMSAIERTESFVRSQEEIQNAFSPATMVKSLNQAMNKDDYAYYSMPQESSYALIKPFLELGFGQMGDILISKDKRKVRISAKIKDVGAENIKVVTKNIDNWIAENIPDDLIQFKQTGTGLLLDKNSVFVKESLLYGLGMALIMVSLLMGLLFQKFKMLLIALIPNIIPLLFAGALIGYLGIALEAGITIVFAIIFGIAVDDTIHFLSKYKLAKDRLKDRELALQVTFQETGKAIIFTSIILFFGFMIMLFSANLPSVIIGLLISVTLLSALVADLIFLPIAIRMFNI